MVLIKGRIAQSVEVIPWFADKNRIFGLVPKNRIEEIENLDPIGFPRDAFPIARAIVLRFLLDEVEFAWLHRGVHFAHEGHGIGRDGGVLMFVERTEKGKAGKCQNQEAG